MSESQPIGQSEPNAAQDIQEKGLEFLVGFDVPRTWATGAQVFVTPETTSIVFREQVLLHTGERSEGLVRNVASVVLPTGVAKEISAILQRELGAIGGQEG